jgi:uncharacterized membrane protein YebE (DUF533 family)
MLIDELIEKAFSDGYEYAQREFNKKKIDAYDNMEISLYKIPGMRSWMDSEEKADYLKRAGQGAVVAGLVGVGAGCPVTAAIGGALGASGGTALRRYLRKNNKKYDSMWKKQADKAKVAHGEMSREEYAEKWGK